MSESLSPTWLAPLAVISLVVALLCSIVIVVDLLKGNKQQMWIMNVVWPITALYGSAFQYFTIVPMRNLPVGKGLRAAFKADVLSLSAWQVGMYGWMAVAVFAIFRHEIEKTSPVFWFMMQIAMWFGFMTSYPVNWWLLKKGLKEKM